MKLDVKILDTEQSEILGSMRKAFAEGAYLQVQALLSSLGDIKTVRSGIRIDAVALAARAKLAEGDRKGARQLLQQVWAAKLKNHRQCRQLAIACLELGDYDRARELVEAAISLAQPQGATH
jgi:thioredoxin-like negative regulator of GroEL